MIASAKLHIILFLAKISVKKKCLFTPTCDIKLSTIIFWPSAFELVPASTQIGR